MERELIEEIATMKGGQGRLDRIAEKLRAERAAVTRRQHELDDLVELCGIKIEDNLLWILGRSLHRYLLKRRDRLFSLLNVILRLFILRDKLGI